MWYFTCFLLWKKRSQLVQSPDTSAQQRNTLSKAVERNEWATGCFSSFFILERFLLKCQKGQIYALMPIKSRLEARQTEFLPFWFIIFPEQWWLWLWFDFLKDGERDHPYGYDWPEKNALFLAFSQDSIPRKESWWVLMTHSDLWIWQQWA